MKAIFKCANCSKETEFTLGGRITLLCQTCGCLDIYFNMDVQVAPANPGQEFESNFKLVPAQSPFLGHTPSGMVWVVSLPSMNTPSVDISSTPKLVKRRK